MEIKLFVATKAFIIHNNKVLLLRESNKYADGTNRGKLDVVGGRVTPGEHFKECLKREIFEETGLSVTISKPFFVNEWRPIIKEEQAQIVGIFFECFSDSEKVILSEDHKSYEWINPSEYKNFKKIIPNLYPAFEAYLSR